MRGWAEGAEVVPVSTLALPALLVAAALAAQDPGGDAIVEPPPRAPIAGVSGLALTSVLSWSDGDGATLEADLSVWLVFPARARWQRTPRPARPGSRELAFRYGPQTWRVESGSAESRRLEGEAARRVELELELRRALWLWPEGFEWSGSGGFRSAPLDTPALADGEPWFLVARLGDGDRPAEMGLARGAPDSDPRSLLHVRALTWQTSGERDFPAGFDLHLGPALAWHERVTATYFAPQALDHFFLPPDRKQGLVPVTDAPPREVRLPERAERRQALPEGTGWEEAVAAARRLAALERERLGEQGPALAPGVLVELDREGRPRAVRVELAELPAELPEGWVRAPEQAAWDQRLATPGPVSAQLLARLRAYLGPSERSDWAFVRLAPDDLGSLRAVVVQPFEREVH